jgi:hypothetical protein
MPHKYPPSRTSPNNSSQSVRDLAHIKRWQSDAFGNEISNRTNVLDLAAHYPYSPERWRLFVGGTRQFPEYGSVAQYNHTGDYHELKPAAGETVTFESAERPRYVVAYELAATYAFATNQSLQPGDSIRVGLYDGSNGWYMEHSGGQDDDIADFVLERNGSEVYRETDIDIKSPVTAFARLKLTTGWYDITRQKWERSFSDGGDQDNPVVGRFSADASRGSKTGNLPIHFSVTADANTTDLILEAGSAALVNLGTTTALTRNKIATETFTVSSKNTWVPQFALRIDPDNPNVNIQLSDVAIVEQNTQSDVRLSAQACDPSNVLDSGGNELTSSDYSTPEILSDTNQAMQISTAVEQFPDSTGSTVTSTGTPGGWQVGYDALFTAQGNNTADQAAGNIASKRPVYSRDTIVFLANAGGTGEVSVNYRTEQDW